MCKTCRSRKILQNDCSPAEIGLDAIEGEPSTVAQNQEVLNDSATKTLWSFFVSRLHQFFSSQSL